MITPFLHRVLLKLDDVSDSDPTFKAVKAAGLAIPDHILDREKHAVVWGTVVAVGPTAFKDYQGDPSWLKVGSRVVIAKYSGKVVDYKGEKFTVVNDEDVILVENNNE